MPLYEYHCVDCGVKDVLIAGLDDHAALCIRCGGVMLRRDEDVFGPYFEKDHACGLGPGLASFLSVEEGRA